MSQNNAPPRKAKGERVASLRPSGPPPALTVPFGDGLAPSAKRRSYAACFAAFLSEARAQPASEVLTFPGDARLALSNVRRALDDVFADPNTVAQHLVMFPVAQAMEAADVARALVHADVSVQYVPSVASGARAVLKRIAGPRKSMVNVAVTLADRGLLPADQVAKLGRTRGMQGTINDAIVVSALFANHADAIKGMHPFTAKEVASLQQDAEWLRENMKPKGARKAATKRGGRPEDDRNRMWTLLVKRHALLQRIAGYFYGVTIEQHVSPLRSRVHAPLSIESDEPAPSPAPNT